MHGEGLPRVFGSYTLLSLKGSGGSGSVFLARRAPPAANTVVVVKTLHEDIVRDEVALLRFRHEAMISVAISSPHVARVYEVGAVGDLPYIAMEHVEGWSLTRVMNAAVEADRAIPVPLAVAWLVDALRGLHALHVAVHPETRAPLSAIHRDVAPKNLMIGSDLGLRVIDFGLGSSSAQEWATRVGALLGTPGYMAPEQRGGARLDPRVDVYSLGVVAWELLALERYARDGRSSWRPIGRPDVPAPLEAAIRRALEPDPAARFSDAEEMRRALEPFAASSRDPRELPPRLFDELELVNDEVTDASAWVDDPKTRAATVEPTRVFARRPPSEEPGEVTGTWLERTAPSSPGEAPVEETLRSAPRTELLEPTFVGPTRVLTPSAARPVPARPSRSSAAGVGAALAAVGGIALAAWALWPAANSPRSDVVASSSAPPLALVATASRAGPEPSARATPEPIARATPEPSARATPEPSARPSPSRTAAPRVSPRATAPTIAPSPPPRPAPTAKPPASPREALEALMRAAASARRAHPEHGAEIDEVVADATMWSRSKDPELAMRRLSELERRLADLVAKWR